MGTSSARAILFDGRANPVPGANASQPLHVRTTPDGGAEMDPHEIIGAAVSCLAGALRQLQRPLPVAAVAMSTFWHTIIGLDDRGRAITPAYMWLDTRATPDAQQLAQRLDPAVVHARTGCFIHPSYAPAKLLWLRRRDPTLFRRCRRWVSPGEYIHLRLLGQAVCSPSMASGTGLFEFGQLSWYQPMLEACGIDSRQLSPVSGAPYEAVRLRPEHADRLAPLRDATWLPALGDGACSNVGCGCTSPSRVALMVGTSGAIRLVHPGRHLSPPSGLWCYLLDAERAVLGGALSNGGNLIAWLRAAFRITAAEERVAAQIRPDSHGLTFVPLLAGERSPGWAGRATGTLHGLTLATRPAHVLRAGMEAVACRFAAVHELLLPHAHPEHQLVATGAALLGSPAWLQMMADAIGRPVAASREREASCRGAALMALESIGALGSVEAAPAHVGKVYQPDPESHARYAAERERLSRWYSLAMAQDAPSHPL